MINAAGRNIPEIIKGYKTVQPYAGPFSLVPTGRLAGPKIRMNKPGRKNCLNRLIRQLKQPGSKMA